MEAIIYNKEGKESGKVKLPESVFGVKWNSDLVHQVATSMLSNARGPIAHAKNRGEVSGGGKKPWQQKGLGRARHGSTRSPIWVHGGAAHGPRNDKNYDRKINKKMRAVALFSLLSRKNKDGKIIFVESIDIKSPKTKDAVSMMESLSKAGFKALTGKKKNAAFITVPELLVPISKSFNNIPNVEVDSVKNLNPIHLLNSTYLIITEPKKAIEFFENKLKD